MGEGGKGGAKGNEELDGEINPTGARVDGRSGKGEKGKESGHIGHQKKKGGEGKFLADHQRGVAEGKGGKKERTFLNSGKKKRGGGGAPSSPTRG